MVVQESIRSIVVYVSTIADECFGGAHVARQHRHGSRREERSGDGAECPSPRGGWGYAFTLIFREGLPIAQKYHSSAIAAIAVTMMSSHVSKPGKNVPLSLHGFLSLLS